MSQSPALKGGAFAFFAVSNGTLKKLGWPLICSREQGRGERQDEKPKDGKTVGIGAPFGRTAHRPVVGVGFGAQCFLPLAFAELNGAFGGYQTICAASGVSVVPIGEEDGRPGPGSGCPLCLIAAVQAGLEPSETAFPWSGEALREAFQGPPRRFSPASILLAGGQNPRAPPA